MRILDGPHAPILCASKTAFEPCDDCDHPEDCQVRHSMVEVRDAISAVLDNMTLEQMVAKGSSVEKEIAARKLSRVTNACTQALNVRSVMPLYICGLAS